MLRQRLLTAGIGIPVGLLLIWLGGWYLAGAVALLATGGLRELYRLMEARDRRAYPWLGYPLAISLMVAVTTSPPQSLGPVSGKLEPILLAQLPIDLATLLVSLEVERGLGDDVRPQLLRQ